MSVTPFRVAKLAAARRVVTELLNERRCPFPDEVARAVVDELLSLGWTYPGWQDDEHLPQPSSSTPEGRAKARRIYAETRATRADSVADRLAGEGA